MTAELWPCTTCDAPGVLNLGTHGYCTTHASVLLRSFDPSVWSLNGRWVQTGCLRPDHGPGYAECECPACGATAVSVVGSPCAYCAHARERLASWRREAVLTPPEGRTREALKAWGERLAVAVKAEIVTVEEARRVWRREVNREHRTAA